jgi:hypothetical protein
MQETRNTESFKEIAGLRRNARIPYPKSDPKLKGLY